MSTKFTPFPVPTVADRLDKDGQIVKGDLPLVTPAGHKYRCSGCGTLLPEGFWIHDTVKNGMVVGLVVQVGSDGPIIHVCGRP